MKKRTIFILLALTLALGAAAVSAQNGKIECTNGKVTIGFSAPANLDAFTCLTVPNGERAADKEPVTTAKLESATIVFDQLRTANSVSPEMSVFPVAGLSQLNPEIYQKAVDLTGLMNTVNTSGLAAITGDIPVLPLHEKTQLLSAEAKIIQAQGIVGLRFLTAFDDAAAGANNNNLLYAFQGVSTDGRNIVSVLFPIQHSALTAPAASPREYNWAALPEDGWTPRIAELDRIVESIYVR